MKISCCKIFLSLLVLVYAMPVLSQENTFTKLPNPNVFSSVSVNGWVKFKQAKGLNAANLFKENKAAFGLTDSYQMIERKKETDATGNKHTRVQEYYNNVPVLFGEFILHEKNGSLHSGNGKIYTTKKTPAASSIVTELNAISIALKYTNAKKYWWQDTAKENKLKRKLNNPAASYYPKAEPFYYYNNKKDELRPGYKVLIQSFDPGKSGFVYIDGLDASVFLWNAVEISCDPATVTTVWYGDKNIYTYTDPFTSGWDMIDDCTPSDYRVHDYGTATNVTFNSSNNTWTSPRQRSAATCLWSIRQTRDVYVNTFVRNGHDNNGGNLDIYYDYIFSADSRSNANYHYDFAGDDEINVGNNGTDAIEDDWGTLDILAHEFTHGVTQYSASLVYARESGALNESFSDVMGEFVKKTVLNVNDWLHGNDRIVNGKHSPLRNYEAPLSRNQPDRYLGAMWADATANCTPENDPTVPGYNDQCGVHRNSGVQNRMYYLLSVGGNGWTNDSSSRNTFERGNNPYQWSVAGIGIDKAARIAYWALNYYLGSNANYYDSRNAWVHAAADLYGECSNEAIQTGAAWRAVGIFPPAAIGGTICGTYGGADYKYVNAAQIDVANGCTVTILPTNNPVQLLSGTKIVISPGFSAPEGSNFRASVNNDCTLSTY